MTDDLVSRLRAVLACGVTSELPAPDFEELALAVVRYQLGENEAYQAFGSFRGVDAESVQHWTDAPVVPTRAFKTARLMAGNPDGAAAVFRTSGTTLGSDRRGEHYVRDLSIYEAALLPAFARYLLPDGASLPLVALVSDPGDTPDSSLGHMVGVVADRLCTGGEYFFHEDKGLDLQGLDERVQMSTRLGQPVLIVGTAFSLIHWMDAITASGRRHALAEGSRVMDTGGFKGRSRTVAREDLYGAIEDRLGVPRGRIVNEYGMTELLSQFYEPTLADPPDLGGVDIAGRELRGPPWVCTRVLDPDTLAPLPRGAVGLLHHLDLANIHSVSSVLTEDLGVAGEKGFRVLGRAADGEPRGCSLAMEDFLAATADPPKTSAS